MNAGHREDGLNLDEYHSHARTAARVVPGLCLLLAACIAEERRGTTDTYQGTDSTADTGAPTDDSADIQGDATPADTAPDSLVDAIVPAEIGPEVGDATQVDEVDAFVDADDTEDTPDGIDTLHESDTATPTDTAVGDAPDGFVRIPGGSFTMGAPLEEAFRENDETQHLVTVSAFFLQATEVTQAQWFLVFGRNPSHFSAAGGFQETSDRPVENVNWYSAVAYMNALSRREDLTECYDLSTCNQGSEGDGDLHCEVDDLGFKGLGCTGYRFPTEAEWEYAARAGTEGPYYNYPGQLWDIAWYSANSGGETHAAASHALGADAANSFGLFDMLGNVSEWVGDWYGDYELGPVSNPVGPSEGKIGAFRVMRGSSWRYDPDLARAARRLMAESEYRFTDIGFRPARSILETHSTERRRD